MAEAHLVRRITVALAALGTGAVVTWVVQLSPPPVIASDALPLVLVQTIPLGAVKGRIDHLAIDLGRRRLFVAELVEGTLAVVDLDRGEVIRRIDGLREPQGVAYLPENDVVFVADAGDGIVHRFVGTDLTPDGTLDLGDDADNIRVDGTDRMVVGFGRGGLAAVDAGGRRLGVIDLPTHPEGFRIDATRNRIYVDLPNRMQVASIDRSTGRIVGSWGPALAIGNYAMALDEARGRLFVAYRFPAIVTAIDVANGSIVGKASTCGDVDDLSFDAARNRMYASCGSGQVAGYDAAARSPGGPAQGFVEVGRVVTGPGARTSLFVPGLDRLFVAVPEREGRPAEVQVLAPR